MKTRMFTLLALALSTASGSILAGGLDRLQAFTRGLNTLEGRFSQSVHDSRGAQKESASGTVAMHTPNRFRWEYQRPYQQTIIADGRTVWIYEPDLQQATRRAQGAEEEANPLSALLDKNRLERQFNVSEGGTQEGLEWLEIRPKQQAGASFERARLGFNAQGLARAVIHDSLGQRTEMRFEAWRRNVRLAESTFRFTPPAGVDVIGE